MMVNTTKAIQSVNAILLGIDGDAKVSYGRWHRRVMRSLPSVMTVPVAHWVRSVP